MTIAMLMNNCVETIRGREERAEMRAIAEQIFLMIK